MKLFKTKEELMPNELNEAKNLAWKIFRFKADMSVLFEALVTPLFIYLYIALSSQTNLLGLILWTCIYGFAWAFYLMDKSDQHKRRIESKKKELFG